MYMCILLFYCLFFFKQKTAYEMRISDWSSDVCSSDLTGYAILPSEDHDATIGQVGPDDLSLRKVPRQSDRIPALVSPRPKIRDHSPPPGFGRCVDRKSTRLNSSH